MGDLIPTDPAYAALFKQEEQLLSDIGAGVVANPHQNLITVNEHFWRRYTVPSHENEALFPYPVNNLMKSSWSTGSVNKSSTIGTFDVTSRLRQLDKYLTPNTVIAGGAIFSILFGLPINDIDLFFVGVRDGDTATNILTAQLNKWNVPGLTIRSDKSLRDRLQIRKEYPVQSGYVNRSDNAVSLRVLDNDTGQHLDVQYILRLYQSVTEVIHGFDVDCCCMAYDGQQVWMTPRCNYALTKGYNTLTKDRMSPSYEFRLTKYAFRGIPLLIPNFNYGQWHSHGTGKILSKLPIEVTRGLRQRLREEFRAQRHGFQYLMLMGEFIRRYRRTAIHLLRLERNRVSDYGVSTLYAGSGHPWVVGNQIKDQQQLDDAGELDMVTQMYIIGYPQHIIAFVAAKYNDLKSLFHLPEIVRTYLAKYRVKAPPGDITYKVTKPGEQITGSFHKIVLDKPGTWWFENIL
jgi:hypothetical protein